MPARARQESAGLRAKTDLPFTVRAEWSAQQMGTIVMSTETIWNQVEQLAPTPEATDRVFRLVDEIARARQIESTRWVDDSGGEALVVSLLPLIRAAEPDGQPPVGVGPGDRGLLISATTNDLAISSLLTLLSQGTNGAAWPEWLGVPSEPALAEQLLDRLRSLGLALLPPVGAIRLGESAGAPEALQLYRLPDPPAGPGHPLMPSGKKVPEGPGNLSGRASWFRRRTGSYE
jgi:hypothetical protein